MAREPFERTGDDEPEIVVSTTRARQGETSGRMRWVLTASVTLAVILMVVAYFYFQR
jgi:hypothetical protein